MGNELKLDKEQNLQMENIANKTSQAANGLVEFQGVVEEVYEKIAFNLPEIDSVIKQNDREAKSMLGMISSEQNQGDIKNKIEGMVTKADQSIDLFSNLMQTMTQREQDLINLVKQELKNVDDMKKTFGRVQIVLSDIEMTTANALETADRTGQAGKSFRYLVKEVIKISTQSELIVKKIMNLWNQLALKTQTFFQIEQGITSLSKKELDTLHNNLQTTFNASTENLQQLTLSLRDVVLRNEDVDVAIMNVMEAMQNQDIIKQCMDNIILSLNETNYYARKHIGGDINFSELPDGEKKQILDEFAFQQEVPNLCMELLNNVHEQLKESNNSLELNFGVLRGALDDGIKPPPHQESFEQNGEGLSPNLDKILSDARAGIDAWFENINVSIAEKEKLLSTCNYISIIFDRMEKQLMFLRNATFRFRLIVILSKTELMKATVFSDHKIAQKLNEMTKKIDQLIKQSEEQMKKVEGAIRQFMVSFSNNLNESSIKTSIFADEMNSCLEYFSDYKGEITKTLTNMTTCGKKLSHLFSDFFQGVKQIEKMIQENSRFKEIFNSISNQIHLIREMILQEKLEGWQISDERLLSIINKFTVFSHKKIADDMFDLGIEEGDAGGDLTLF
jgi:hypothetical protein